MRAAIIGTGYIGRVHARLIRELGGKVVAACGRTLASAQAFGAGTAYDDVDAMLRAEKPGCGSCLFAQSLPQRACDQGLRGGRPCPMRKADGD